MGFRIMLMAMMGLGAMYMMHLLAQDWNRLKPIMQVTQALGSASAPFQQLAQSAGGFIPPLQQIAQSVGGASAALMRGRRAAPTLQRELSWVKGAATVKDDSEAALHPRRTPGIDWKRILSRDPFDCLQSLICQLMSGAEAQSTEAALLMDYLEASLELAPAKIGRAFSRGLALRGSTERCYDEYPFCLYSAKTMLRILRWFSETNSVLEE